MRLEKSRLKGLETEALRAVPKLKRLLMAHCSGLQKLPVETLIGNYGILYSNNLHTKILNIRLVLSQGDRLHLDEQKCLCECGLGELN